MFDEILNFISTVFTIAIIIFAVLIVIAIIKGIEGQRKNEEIKIKKQKEEQELIRRIILETPKTPTSVLVFQRDELLEAYRELRDCKQRGSMKVKEIIPAFHVGDYVSPIFVDMNLCLEIVKIFNDEIDRRQG